MIGFFPTPHEDEILYSVLARYHQKSGNTSITATVEDLFGVKKLTAIIDFPCNLSNLISSMPVTWNFKLESLVNNNTLFPLYNPFWTKERSKTILEIMKGKSSQLVHRKSGAISNSFSQLKYLRFCPICFEKDISEKGEAYWHRLHQVKGVLVCPDHKVELQNSKIKTYELNPQCYYPANVANCNYNNEKTSEYSLNQVDRLSSLAEDVRFIINNNEICSKGPEWIKNSYLTILSKQGLISWKGKVDQETLVDKFIEYYTPEFLSALDSMPDPGNTHNWVSMMVRKYDILPHPIKHLLIIKFLAGSIQGFFQTNQNDKLFEEGPYPCLNGASEHYLQPVITDKTVSYSRNKNPIATFSCPCGFIYTRKGPDKSIEDLNKYTTIKEYGSIWENRLRELIEGKKLHLREVARELKVDLSTVRKYVARLNLKTEWMLDESADRFRKSGKDKSIIIAKNVRYAYRNRWLALTLEHKDTSKSRLRKIDVRTYNWLNYNDKEWLKENSPVLFKKIKPDTIVNWENRDRQLKQQIEEIVKKLLESDGRPERISSERIGKELGILYLLRNSLNKIPITKTYLESVRESIEEYRIRRIKWAAKELESNGVPLKEWKIRELTGLFNVSSSAIDNTINDEIDARDVL